MKTLLVMVPGLILGLVGCSSDYANVTDPLLGTRSDAGVCICSDASTMCPPVPDLKPAGPDCMAANGLHGTRLLCVDFDKSPDLSSWNFSMNGANGWSVQAGKLRFTSDFGNYMGAPLFYMPTIDVQKYDTVILSVLHRIDISENATQKALIMMGSDDPINRLVDQSTGKQPRKQSIHLLARGAVPGGSYQPLFKYVGNTGTAGSTFTGWQIESIAVLGLP